jgi:hypothetical protein
MQKFLSAVVALIMVNACSFMPNNPLPPSHQKSKLYRLYNNVGKQVSVLEITPGSTVFADQVLAKSLNLGLLTPPVEQLVAKLTLAQGGKVAVIGENDELAAATILSALQNLNGLKPTATLYFVGDARYAPALKSAAAAASLSFQAIAYP